MKNNFSNGFEITNFPAILDPHNTIYMTNHFKWGILGLGKIAGKFVRNLKVLPDAEIYAVGSRSQDKAAAFAAECGATKAYGSYEALLADPQIDAVYVATPHVFHYEHTMMCLERRIPVLCEKPFAMNRAEVAAMINRSREQETFLMEAMWTRFLPSILKAQEIIDQGKIGKVTGIKADFGFKGPEVSSHRLLNPALGGGSVLDIGIYPIFLALLILGKPERIQVSSILGETGVDLDAGILFQYGGRATAHLHSSIISNTTTEAFIYGTKGSIHLPRRWHEADGLEVRYHDGGSERHRFNYLSNGYYFEAQEVMACVRQGMQQSPLMPHSLSLQLIELLDEIVNLAGVKYS